MAPFGKRLLPFSGNRHAAITFEGIPMRKDIIGSFMAGAAVMYFADPIRGRRRRAAARDQLAARWHDTGDELDRARRDFSHRVRGMAAAARPWGHRQANEPILVARVRSAIGWAVSHPHAIQVRADGSGRIALEGLVLRHEHDYLLKRVAAVRGVREVINRLEVHTDREGISSLQGGVPRRALAELAQQQWTPSLRVASAALSPMFFSAAARNRGPLRWAAAGAGAALMARAVVNRPFRQMLGLTRGAAAVHFDKTIHIDAPRDEVYAFWSNFANFPKFMNHLKEVRILSEGKSHWVAAGPGGVSIPWDAEITERRPDELIAWASVPGSLIRTVGVVRFDREPDGGTRIQIRMSYCPPAGVLGHAIAWLFGADPKSEMDDDLVRLKSLLEVGKTHAHGRTVTREQFVLTSAEEPGPAI